MYPCKCSTCTDVVEAVDVEMEDLDEKEKKKQYQKIAQESLNVRVSDFSEEGILFHAKQII